MSTSANNQFDAIENLIFSTGGTGIHWPLLDEGLKGFLQDELRKLVKSKKDKLAAQSILC